MIPSIIVSEQDFMDCLTLSPSGPDTSLPAEQQAFEQSKKLGAIASVVTREIETSDDGGHFSQPLNALDHPCELDHMTSLRVSRQDFDEWIFDFLLSKGVILGVIHGDRIGILQKTTRQSKSA